MRVVGKAAAPPPGAHTRARPSSSALQTDGVLLRKIQKSWGKVGGAAAQPLLSEVFASESAELEGSFENCY